MKIVIYPSEIKGFISTPSSKSQSLRALFFAAFAKSQSIIHQLLYCDDTYAMIDSLIKLGSKINLIEDKAYVTPLKKELHNNIIHLNVRNSGITFRFLASLALLLEKTIIIDGEDSIQKQRPINELLTSLNQLGGSYEFLKKNQNAPVKIQGSIKNYKATIFSKDSQPITSLLYLASLSKKQFEVFFDGCEEKPWLNLSFSWLNYLNIPYERKENYFIAKTNNGFDGFEYFVPGDFSALAFFVVLSCIHKQELEIKHTGILDPQPDRIILSIFCNLGGSYIYNEKTNILKLTPPKDLKGFIFDLEQGIDLLPILAVLGCFCKTETTLYNGKIARLKESDRIFAITNELRKMDAVILENKDGVTIFPSNLKGSQVWSHKDHRIAMSLAIAATKAIGFTTIHEAECTKKTFPEFFNCLKKLNANIT